MNISEISQASGLTAKSIRFYEEKGIIQPPARSENGYRIYTEQHLVDLHLIAQAKRVGFSLEECKSLVSLAHDPERKSQVVKAKAQQKLRQVKSKLAELESIRNQLEQWIDECPGDEGSHCPILGHLTDDTCSQQK